MPPNCANTSQLPNRSGLQLKARALAKRQAAAQRQAQMVPAERSQQLQQPLANVARQSAQQHPASAAAPTASPPSDEALAARMQGILAEEGLDAMIG